VVEKSSARGAPVKAADLLEAETKEEAHLLAQLDPGAMILLTMSVLAAAFSERPRN